MSKKIGKLLALASAISLMALSLSACSSDQAEPSATPSPSDNTSDAQNTFDLEAAWLSGGDSIVLVTRGSSNCLPSVTEVSASGTSQLKVTLEPAAEDLACLRDFVPQFNVIEAPSDLDRSAPITLKVEYLDAIATAELAAVSDYTSGTLELTDSAGWASDTSIVLVTYGSSSCVPMLESAARDAEGNVVVNFADLATEQACTADLAPRFTFIEGIESGKTDGVNLILNGDGYAGEKVPVLP